MLGVFLIAGSGRQQLRHGSEPLARRALGRCLRRRPRSPSSSSPGRLGISVLLRSRLPQEIERGNTAAGLAAGAHYVATGIITSRAVAGSDLRGLGLSLALLRHRPAHAAPRSSSPFARSPPTTTPSRSSRENLAAALSYAGLTVARRAHHRPRARGRLRRLGASLAGYGKALLFVLALYPVRQILVQMAFLGGGFTLRRGPLDAAIEERRNAGVAALEAASYLATALLVGRLG